MLNDAGKRGVITSIEARTVIALFLRREAKYKEAIQVVRGLKNQYPHDFLFCLEEANLRKDAARAWPRWRLTGDHRRQRQARLFCPGAVELAYFGLGDALRGQRHFGEAAQAYEQAAWTKNVSPELKIRSLLAAGECRDMNGERQLAVKDYQAAIDAGPNTSRADQARKYLRNAYSGN
jgi:tetratricopeptide (TPR) repeat protein